MIENPGPDATPPTVEPAVETRVKASAGTPGELTVDAESEIGERWPETTAIAEKAVKVLAAVGGVDASKVVVAWSGYAAGDEQGLTLSMTANWRLPRPVVEPALPPDLDPDVPEDGVE